MFALKCFKIKIKNFLFQEEQKNLFLLYQPLIGSKALTFYFTLYFLANFDDQLYFMHQFLLDLLNMNEKDFLKNKDKLEAIKLLETFQNNKKEIIYFLNTPLKPFLFFQDPVLSQFLLSEVGDNIYCYLKKLFSQEKDILKPEYKNISKNFTDVYSFKKVNIQEAIKKYNNIDIQKNSDNFQKYFDYDLFIKSLPERFKKPFLLEWKNIDYIVKLGFVYGIEPQKMAILFQDNFRDLNEFIDLDNLKNFIKSKLLQENNDVKLIHSYKHKKDDDDEEMIVYLQNAQPHRIIKNFSKSKHFLYGLYDIVFLLMEKTNADIGVINALLMYVCKIKDQNNSPVPSFNYFKTILDSWFKKGIVSAKKAYYYLMEKEKIKIFEKNKKNRPKWLDQIQKELKF
ncbi:DnaD domain protein [Candidatus Phytoplasma palmae]|uniref:DnaD domain protein n=1 Tax=Candidatus Phytoplasma palmae TaxID=85624 RepID=UPI003990D3EC